MDDKRIELLRSDEGINLELEDEADAWKQLFESLPQSIDDIRNMLEKPTIKTEWLKKKTR